MKLESLIQQAADEVSALPLGKDSFCGAMLLGHGEFKMCAEHYGNDPVAADGCEDLNVGIHAGLTGEIWGQNIPADAKRVNQKP